MKSYLAKHLYCLSLGFDQSEGVLAYGKEADRCAALKRRIGDDAYAKWQSEPIWPYFAIHAVVIFAIIGTPLWILVAHDLLQ